MAYADGSASKTLTVPRSHARAEARFHRLKNVSPIPQVSPHRSALVAQHLILGRQVAEHVLAVFGNEDQAEQAFGKAWR